MLSTCRREAAGTPGMDVEFPTKSKKSGQTGRSFLQLFCVLYQETGFTLRNIMPEHDFDRAAVQDEIIIGILQGQG